MTVLILASGECPEWIWGHYTKHTIPFAGEPLIARTVRQLRELGHDPVVVTDNPLVEDVCGTACFRPAKSKFYADTLLSTLELWHGRVTVLNGDVLWIQRSALEYVLDYDAPITFFGDQPSTILGFEFKPSAYDLVAAACSKATHPWQLELYNRICAEFGVAGGGCNWHVVVPDTQDFDGVQEYLSYLKDNEWARLGNPSIMYSEAASMTKEQLEDRIAKLAPWDHTYELPLGVTTTKEIPNDFDLLLDAGLLGDAEYSNVGVVGAGSGWPVLWLIDNKKTTWANSIEQDEHIMSQQLLLRDLRGLQNVWTPTFHDLELPFCTYNWCKLTLIFGKLQELEKEHRKVLLDSCFSALKPGIGASLVVLDSSLTTEELISAGFKDIDVKVLDDKRLVWIANRG